MTDSKMLEEYQSEMTKMIWQWPGSRSFEDLAIHLYELQRSSDVYGKIATESVDNWTQIPCLPISMFKYKRVACFPEEYKEQACYRSSGTTQENRSSHHMYSTLMYRESITSAFKSLLIKDFVDPYVVCVSAKLDRASSSLFEMMSTIIEFYDGQVSEQNLFTDFQDEQKLSKWLLDLNNSSIYTEERDLVLFGTTLALVDMCQNTTKVDRESIIVVETGGMKGRDFGQLTADDLTKQIADKFGQTHLSFREYGMSEMSSQLYGRVLRGEPVRYVAPPWLRYRTVDVVTGEEVGVGEEGIIQFYDLANVWSCGFIQTEDVGVVNKDGSLTLNGRAKGAVEKGCSISFAQAMEAVDGNGSRV